MKAKLKPKPKRSSQFKIHAMQILFDNEDRALLERVSAAEKLSKAEALRRGLRLYAKDLGLARQPAA